ncbi:Protein kinase C-like protein, partial [Tolypocladium paradoxum]
PPSPPKYTDGPSPAPSPASLSAPRPSVQRPSPRTCLPSSCANASHRSPIMNDDEAIRSIQAKIEREEALMTAAMNMRSLPINEGHRSRIDSELRDNERNIKFFKERLEAIKQRKVQQGLGSMSLAEGDDGGPPPAPPPKDPGAAWGDRGSYGAGSAQYSQVGQHGDLMPPRHPYAPPGPGAAMPKPRPNFTKLDLIKYDTPYLGPRIQLMLSQIQFKLNVEEQYLKGVEKMVQLYGMEGDRKSKADAAARRVESKQKIVLLKQALKRYEELHIDMDSSDAHDDDSINTPNLRKPLSGRLAIRVMGVKGVDHAATGRFARGPETFVAVKVEDTVVARTKASRTDRWENEHHAIDVDKANEIEVTVYDKPGEHPIPIGMLWVRISDIVEEMRRKRIEAEMNFSGWVSADQMGSPTDQMGNPTSPPAQFPMSQTQGQYGGHGAAPGPQGQQQQGGQYGAPGPQPQVNVGPIDGWFNLEPTGQIQLQFSFVKQSKDRRQVDLGLGRKGAVRQRKEEVHEMYGHKFVQHQFYNIMRCALCGDFLKYSAGMQCEDCKYTCHTKCYPSVVTKCISKSNAETDPDEEKINHRIPHRFQPWSNMTANWCCHCGYILPFGKKNCRKCSECGLTSHAQCVHLVPDFCGMSMAVANQILEGIRIQKQRQAKASSMSDRTLRSGTSKMSPTGTSHSSSPSYSSSAATLYTSTTASTEATEAAKVMYANQTSPQRPAQPVTAPSNTAAAAAAATAAMSGSASGLGQRQPSDYGRYGGYDQPSPQQEDPYGHGGQYGGQPQQRKYNPADYANVNAPYGGQAPATGRPVQQQQPAPLQQPQQQQPYPTPAPVQKPHIQESPAAQRPTVYGPRVLSQAMQEEFRGFSYTADFE